MGSIHKGHGAFAKLFVEGVGVEAEFELDAGFALDGLRLGKGRGGDGRHGCETGGTGKKPSAIENEHGVTLPFTAPNVVIRILEVNGKRK